MFGESLSDLNEGRISEPLREQVVRMFPALKGLAFQRADKLDLDHVYRRALFSFLTGLRPDVEEGLLESVDTWGDVEQWFGANAADAPSGRGVYDDRAYSGPIVALRPVVPEHMDSLYRASFDPRWAFRWRFRGRTLSFESFAREAFSAVHAQLAVVDRHDESRLLGLVVGYNADLGNGHLWVGFQRVEDTAAKGAMTEAAILFIQYCFNHWPLRMVLFEIPEFNYGMFSMMTETGLARVEGRIRDFFFHDGEYHDQVFLSIDRATWTERLQGWFV